MAGTLIVALDVDTRREAESLVTALDGTADFFKIGYQLFYGGDGFALGKELLAAGKRVFFDLKLLDIDNTVLLQQTRLAARDSEKKLSEARATAVKDALAKLSPKTLTMIATGYGAANPIADNKTEKTRAPNRRVEIFVKP